MPLSAQDVDSGDVNVSDLAASRLPASEAAKLSPQRQLALIEALTSEVFRLARRDTDANRECFLACRDRIFGSNLLLINRLHHWNPLRRLKDATERLHRHTATTGQYQVFGVDNLVAIAAARYIRRLNSQNVDVVSVVFEEREMCRWIGVAIDLWFRLKKFPFTPLVLRGHLGPPLTRHVDGGWVVTVGSLEPMPREFYPTLMRFAPRNVQQQDTNVVRVKQQQLAQELWDQLNLVVGEDSLVLQKMQELIGLTLPGFALDTDADRARYRLESAPGQNDQGQWRDAVHSRQSVELGMDGDDDVFGDFEYLVEALPRRGLSFRAVAAIHKLAGRFLDKEQEDQLMPMLVERVAPKDGAGGDEDPGASDGDTGQD
ncbi:hypothetical protein ACJ41O_003142 [Fusarium nematophilum]